MPTFLARLQADWRRWRRSFAPPERDAAQKKDLTLARQAEESVDPGPSPVSYLIQFNRDQGELPSFFWHGERIAGEPSLGLVEFSSIAVGVKACDRMLKSAPVFLLEAKAFCPGRLMVLVHGDAVSVEFAMAAGRSAGGEWLHDQLYLPRVAPEVIAVLAGNSRETAYDCLGVVETGSVAAGLAAADTMAKVTTVELFQIRLARELGGKSYVVAGGTLAEVEAALDAVGEALSEGGHLLAAVTVPVPDPALVAKMGLPGARPAMGGMANVLVS